MNLSTNIKPPKSNLDFKFMSFFFKIRDFFKPPLEKVKKAGIKSGNIVLDYGCGPGSYAIAAAKIVGSSGKIYAVDTHPLALKMVREKAEKNELNNIQTVRTDCKIPLDDKSVDIIICFDVIHALKDLSCNLVEFHRILKPDGKLSLDDHHYEGSELISLVAQTRFFELSENNDKIYNFKKILIKNLTKKI